jgi:hypothetical protein
VRTTITIDDDLAVILQRKAAQRGVAFKHVVNSLLRAGLGASEEMTSKRKLLKVVGRPLGMRPGFDPDKLNQFVDELEAEEHLKIRQES